MSRLRGAALSLIVAAVFIGGLPSTVEAFYWMPGAASYQWGIITYLFWLSLLNLRFRRGEGHERPRLAGRADRDTDPGASRVQRGQRTDRLRDDWRLHSRRAVEGTRQRSVPVDVARHHRASDSGLFRGAGKRQSKRRLSGARVPSQSRVRADRDCTPDSSIRLELRFLPGSLAGSLCGLVVGDFSSRRSSSIGCGGPHMWRQFSCASCPVLYLTLFPLYWEYGEMNYSGEGRTYNVSFMVLCAIVLTVAGSLVGALAGPSVSAGVKVRPGWIDVGVPRVCLPRC